MIALFAAACQAAVSNYSFQLRDGAIYIAGPSGSEKVEAPKPAPRTGPLYASGRTTITFDARGLTVRKGAQALSSTLKEVAVSPRIFPKEQILETRQLIERKARTSSVSSVLAVVRLGDRLFLVARWLGADGHPWLDALFDMDAEDDSLKPHLLGRLPGALLTPWGKIQFVRAAGEGLEGFLQAEGSWGIWRWSPKTGSQDPFSVGELTLIGNRLKAVRERAGSNQWLSIESTEYGTELVSTLDASTGDRQLLYETSAKVGFVWGTDEYLYVQDAALSRLYVLQTGLTVPAPADARAARFAAGIVLWTGEGANMRAVLYEPLTLRVLARWPLPPGAAGPGAAATNFANPGASNS